MYAYVHQDFHLQYCEHLQNLANGVISYNLKVKNLSKCLSQDTRSGQKKQQSSTISFTFVNKYLHNKTPTLELVMGRIKFVCRYELPTKTC